MHGDRRQWLAHHHQGGGAGRIPVRAQGSVSFQFRQIRRVACLAGRRAGARVRRRRRAGRHGARRHAARPVD